MFRKVTILMISKRGKIVVRYRVTYICFGLTLIWVLVRPLVPYFSNWNILPVEFCLGKEFSYTNHTVSYVRVPGNLRWKQSWMCDVLVVLSSKVSFSCVTVPVGDELRSSSWNTLIYRPWEQGLRMDPDTWVGGPLSPCSCALLRAFHQHPPEHTTTSAFHG